MEISQNKNEPNESGYCPDLVLEKVNENIRYRTKLGENKFLSEPLAPKRFFVLNNYIKLLGPSEEMVQLENSLVRCEESRQKGMQYFLNKNIIVLF